MKVRKLFEEPWYNTLIRFSHVADLSNRRCPMLGLQGVLRHCLEEKQLCFMIKR